MDLTFMLYALNGLLMIAVPIVLGVYLTRKFDLEARLWWIGAAIFILSQVGHLPFNSYIVNPLLGRLGDIAPLPAIGALVLSALALGLSAGLWEELFRYGMFRWWAKEARSWGEGLLAGAGHGGAEAIIVGLLFMYHFINMAIVRNMDVAQLVPADQVAAAEAQIRAFWSAPWYDTLLGALERLLVIPSHLCLSLLVLQTFLRRQGRWVWLAIAYHTLLNAASLIAANLLNPYWTEAIVGAFAVLSVVIIFALRRGGPEQPDITPGS